MNDFLKRIGLLRWITEGAPAFWVIGLSILICAGTLKGLSALFLLLDWRLPAQLAYWGVGALVVSFVACCIWFVYDALTAASRPTPWRK